jgi:hypothetical protein
MLSKSKVYVNLRSGVRLRRYRNSNGRDFGCFAADRQALSEVKPICVAKRLLRHEGLSKFCREPIVAPDTDPVKSARRAGVDLGELPAELALGYRCFVSRRRRLRVFNGNAEIADMGG